MTFRISPLWWPVLVVASPLLVPWLFVKNRRFEEGRARVAELNQKRISQAGLLELPALDFVELTVLVEWKAERGFKGEGGVSYLFRTNLGSLLFDVSYGPTSSALTHNAARLGIDGPGGPAYPGRGMAGAGAVDLPARVMKSAAGDLKGGSIGLALAFLKRTFLFWTSLVLIAVGFVLLGSGEITAAPLLLVTGYCILLPLFLWRSFRKKPGE